MYIAGLSCKVHQRKLDVLDKAIELTFKDDYQLNFHELKFVISTVQNNELKKNADTERLVKASLQNWREILGQNVMDNQLFDKSGFTQAYQYILDNNQDYANHESKYISAGETLKKAFQQIDMQINDIQVATAVFLAFNKDPHKY